MFKNAETRKKRLKMLVWGDTGSGKTLTALRFPRPAVIDLEDGTSFYTEDYQFQTTTCKTADDVFTAVEWLATNKHDRSTLVIDPLTVFWEMIQRKWSDIFLKRKPGTRGHKTEFYAFQVNDWMTIKSDMKRLMHLLTTLDMNVIVTARQKNLYADGGGMQKIGETFDAEKGTAYLFDVVLQLYRNGEKFMARTIKDRTHKLPSGLWENIPTVFTNAYGEELAGGATPMVPKDPVQIQIDAISSYWQSHGKGETADPEIAKAIKATGASNPSKMTYEQAKAICLMIAAKNKE